MKRLIGAALFICFVSPARAQPVVEYYRQVTKTISLPYQLEGLGPLLEPAGREYYRFLRDERGQVLRVTHYNEKGEMTDTAEGWADFHAFYDAWGVFQSGAYYDVSGRLQHKLATPENHLGIEPMPPMKP